MEMTAEKKRQKERQGEAGRDRVNEKVLKIVQVAQAYSTHWQTVARHNDIARLLIQFICTKFSTRIVMRHMNDAIMAIHPYTFPFLFPQLASSSSKKSTHK